MSDISDLINDGKRLEGLRMLDDAIKVYSQAVIIGFGIDSAHNDPRLSEIYNLRGIAKRVKGSFDDAHVDYKMALVYAKDDKQKALAHVNIADIHRIHHNNPKDAHSSLDEALKFAKNSSYEFLKAYDQRGLVFRKEGRIDDAIIIYETAINEFEKSDLTDKNDKDSQLLYAKLLHQLGTVYLSKDSKTEFDKVLELENKAYKIFDDLKNNSGMMNCKITIGDYHKKVFDRKTDYLELDEAIASFNGALGLAGKEDKRAISEIETRLKDVYNLRFN